MTSSAPSALALFTKPAIFSLLSSSAPTVGFIWARATLTLFMPVALCLTAHIVHQYYGLGYLAHRPSRIHALPLDLLERLFFAQTQVAHQHALRLLYELARLEFVLDYLRLHHELRGLDGHGCLVCGRHEDIRLALCKFVGFGRITVQDPYDLFFYGKRHAQERLQALSLGNLLVFVLRTFLYVIYHHRFIVQRCLAGDALPELQRKFFVVDLAHGLRS